MPRYEVFNHLSESLGVQLSNATVTKRVVVLSFRCDIHKLTEAQIDELTQWVGESLKNYRRLINTSPHP